MSDLEYFLLHNIVAITVLVLVDYLNKEPENLFVETTGKCGKKLRAFKSSYQKLTHLNNASEYKRYLSRRLLWQKEPQQSVTEELTSQVFEKTGKTIFFVGKFTDEEMICELLGLKVFEAEIASLPVDHIIVGHGAGDGRYPGTWVVGGKSVTRWLKQLEIKEALVCSCEYPKAVRFCGTLDGRIIRR